MPKPAKPANFLGNSTEMSLMMIEAHSVITMRLMGFAGLWSVSPKENSRMVTEKLAALLKVAADTHKIAMNGGSPDAIAAAAIAPLRKATRANSKRLGKRGMKLG
jgi:hypothetical protein